MKYIYISNEGVIDGEKIIYVWFKTLSITYYFNDFTSITSTYTDPLLIEEDKEEIIKYMDGDPNRFIIKNELYTRLDYVKLIELISPDLYNYELDSTSFTYDVSTNVLT